MSSAAVDEFLAALGPVVEGLGATLVTQQVARSSDQPVIWQGQTVAYVRHNEFHDALERAVAAVEREVGAPLAEMDRGQKQTAIRRLDERGTFLLRGAAEDVALLMGVSKVTLYSYLNAVKRSD